MDKKTLIITIVSVVAIVGFLFGAYAMTSKTEQTDFPQLTTLRERDHAKWSDKKTNILIKYSDFQCPACQAFQQLLTEVEKEEKIKDSYTFVYRHYPLDSIHPNARAAAYAAEAAGQQDKFFEMHDVLFNKQGEWSGEKNPLEKFKSYAEALKLDLAQFEKAYESKEVKDAVQQDFVSGNEVSVNATPTFYVNGKKILNPQSVEEFKQVLLENMTITEM